MNFIKSLRIWWLCKTTKLRVWRNNAIEWVVAETPKDATLILIDYYRDIGLNIIEEGDLDLFEVPYYKELSLHEGEEHLKGTKTAIEFAHLNGRGFLMTSEY